MSEATTGDAQDSYPPSADDKKRPSVFGRFRSRIQHAIKEGRGEEAMRQTVSGAKAGLALPADDIAVRSGRIRRSDRMIVPVGVVIQGPISSSSETLIAGRVDGDVSVEAPLELEATSIVSGKIRAAVCTVHGQAKGDIESTRELVIGESGRVTANAMSARDMIIAGSVEGDVQCGGLLRLMKTADVRGDIRTRSIILDEGARFNGACTMIKPKQRQDSSKKK